MVDVDMDIKQQIESHNFLKLGTPEVEDLPSVRRTFFIELFGVDGWGCYWLIAESL